MTMTEPAATESVNEFVTAVIGGQLFGLPILQVQDVFAVTRLTVDSCMPIASATARRLSGRRCRTP